LEGGFAMFHQTAMGKKFFEHDVPQLVRQLTRIASALEKNNELKAEELAMQKQKNEE
jgi:hypothetical protein